MTARAPGTVDARIVKALGHPLRQRILQVLDDGVASPNEIAQRLGEPLGNVSYHVKILRENDAIELVDTRPVRGAVEHFYRGKMRPLLDDKQWAKLPLATRRAMFGQRIEEIGEHLSAAAAAGGLDRVDTHVSWLPAQLDDKGWAEVAELLAGMLEQVGRIEAESLRRLERADAAGSALQAELVMLLFERAGPG